MTESNADKRFKRQAAFDQRELVGARWWSEGLRVAQAEFRARPIRIGPGASSPTSKELLTKLAVFAGVVGSIAIIGAIAAGSCSSSSSFDETTITRKSLDAQRADGWDLGGRGETLAYPDAKDVDATGLADPVAAAVHIAKDLAPRRADLAPWYVSTLFQSIEPQESRELRTGLRAINSSAMDVAFARGAAVRSLFLGVESPKDVALIVDLPGPESVAFAAGLGTQFDRVFGFDNWPHPKGVVPSHLTLGAAVFYRTWFAAHPAEAGAAPAFVLDRNRLAPYVDEAGRFDNRYVAKIPSAAQLQALRVKHVLYVVPAEKDGELDDLNDDFVALKDGGVDVKILSLTDLKRPVEAAAVAPDQRRTYHYGGYPTSHYWFWHHYGWHRPPTAWTGVAPTGVSRGYDFVPAPRPTIFATGAASPGVVRGSPRGFGTTTYHSSSSSSSDSSGRSGSFGRGAFSGG